MSIEFIARSTTGANFNDMEFINIPQNYTNLLFVLTGIMESQADFRFLLQGANGLPQVNFAGNEFKERLNGRRDVDEIVTDAYESNNVFTSEFLILNYSASTSKAIMHKYGAGNATNTRSWIGRRAHNSVDTAAITGISIFLSSDNNRLNPATTAVLYGVN